MAVAQADRQTSNLKFSGYIIELSSLYLHVFKSLDAQLQCDSAVYGIFLLMVREKGKGLLLIRQPRN